MKWKNIATAPKGGGADDVRDPNWIEPPSILVKFADGMIAVVRWDWYYAEGGSGYDPSTRGNAWLEAISGEPIATHYGREQPEYWIGLYELPI